jgi:plastocyanin
VRFNISSSHNVIFRRTTAGAPLDIKVVTDSIVVRRFTTKGTFPYDCTVHPGMSGEIVVQ